MTIHQLHRRTHLPVAPADAFELFADPMNLQLITPPELDFRVTEPPMGPVCEGAEIGYRLRLWGGVPFRWRSRIVDWRPNSEFVDLAVSSPYRTWHHRHILFPDVNGTTMIDLVSYSLPIWPAGELAHGLVRRQLERIFDYRQSAIHSHFGPCWPAAADTSYRAA